MGYLVDNHTQSSTVKSYISTIKAVLRMNGIKIEEDQYLLSSLTHACCLRNDRCHVRLPIQKGMLRIILRKTSDHFEAAGQPFLSLLYRTLFSTVYFGLFRVSELTLSEHQVKARDIHIGINKDKILFILHSSKTHAKSLPPQMIKIKWTNHKKPNSKSEDMNFCPFQLL